MGRKHTPEEKGKISKALKGRAKSLKHRLHLSIAQKGRHYSPATEFKRGQVSGSNNPFYGKHHSQANKLKWSHAHRGKHFSLCTEWTSKRVKDPEFQESKMVGLRKVMNSPQYRQKRREISMRLCQDPTYIAKISHSQEMREHLSKLTRERVKDPEYMRKVLSSRRPTDIEQIVIDIIKRYNLPYRYTGDGTFQIGGKYPDFVNTNGQKVAIDIFGDYWHNPEEVPERKATFAEYGWKLIVIWGYEIKELSNEQIAKRITKPELLAELRRR